MIERSRCRLSHWFPVVAKTLAPKWYPTTVLVTVAAESPEQLCDLSTASALHAAVDRVIAAIPTYPVFLRSDLVSGKHAWPAALGVIQQANDVPRAIAGIAEFAALAIWFGDRGTDTWAIRELLTPVDAPRDQRGLPIGREWRLIVRDGAVTDESGFYWPAEAIVENSTPLCSSDEALAWCHYVAERARLGYPDELRTMSVQVANALGGNWSVDWMATTTGWKLIDMALADESWIPNPTNAAPIPEGVS